METSILELSEKVKRLCEENRKIAEEMGDSALEAFRCLMPQTSKEAENGK